MLFLWGLAIGAVPLLKGPPGGDDAYYHAMYAVEQARCLSAGVVFPRWYPDLNGGLGGPEPRPRPLLPLLLGGLLAWLLADGVAAIAVTTAAVPVVAALAGYSALRWRGAGQGWAGAAAALWALCPYLVASLHQRVALQEGLALALLPWVWALLLPPGPRGRHQVLGGALVTACLLATQLLVAAMAATAVAAAHLASPQRRLAAVAQAALLGAALSAVSWLPNLFSLGRLRAKSFVEGWFDWRTRFLFSSETAASTLGTTFEWAFLGMAAAAVVLLTLRGARLLAGLSLGCALLATSPSRVLWELVPGSDLLQFPWRWLGVASALAVWAAATAGPRWRSLVALALVSAPVVTTHPLADRLPPGPPLRPSWQAAELGRAATRFGVLPILPSFPAALPRGADPFEALREASRIEPGTLSQRQGGPSRWSWIVTNRQGAVVRLPLLAADGWEVRVGGREVGWVAEASLVSVPVPAGRTFVEARQVLLAEDILGIALSALAWLGLAAALLTWRERGWRGGVR
ncbi:MAG: hypothetical protein HXY19_06495 [Thermoanaerobaculaceae bacterium]|nr:hypothetical protein [Thermoanaerobaculaceae bacterium]